MALEDNIDFQDFFLGQSAARADRAEVQANRESMKPKGLLHDIFNTSFNASTFKASIQRRRGEHEDRLLREDLPQSAAKALAAWMGAVDAKLAWLEAYYPEPNVFRAHGGTQDTVPLELRSTVDKTKTDLAALQQTLRTFMNEDKARRAVPPPTLTETERFERMFTAVNAEFAQVKGNAKGLELGTDRRIQDLGKTLLLMQSKMARLEEGRPTAAPAGSRLLRFYAMFLTHVLIVLGLSGGILATLHYWKR